MPIFRNPVTLAAACLLASLVTGCGASSPSLQIGSEQLKGNWTFADGNHGLALNLGFTQGAYETVSATARLSGSSCISPATDIVLTGSVNTASQLTLVSQPFNDTTLTVTGSVAPSGNSIAGATWTFSGGNCGSLGKISVAATNYNNIGGNYTGAFVDNSGNSFPVTALLEQTTQPNGDGQFSLSGTASFPSNTCFVQQPTITQSVVTGSSLSMTYSDPGSSAVLTAIGTFNAAATQLTISNWTIASGPCGGDSGTGVLNSTSSPGA